jgi:hypothetical protein
MYEQHGILHISVPLRFWFVWYEKQLMDCDAEKCWGMCYV